MSRFKLNKKCLKCGKKITDKNKSGFCIQHRDRSGKNNPFYGKHHSKDTIDIIKIKTSAESKKKWESSEYRNKVIKGMSKPRKAEFGEKQSKNLIEMYKNNPIQRDIRSKAMKKSWATGKIVANGYSCNTSKIQIELLNDIKTIFSDDMSVKTLRLSNNRYLFPDIIIGNTGIIIEFYGDYWHANPIKYNPEDIVHHKKTAQEIWNADKKRIEKIENEGYHVIIIWESDYKENRSQILENLDMLINWERCAW